MKPPHLYIVSVGKGNSAVLLDTNGVVIVDTGLRQKLLQFLLEQSINEIDVVIISHADRDHAAGLIDLLLHERITIKEVRLNADSTQQSKTWGDVIAALGEARRRAGTRIEPGVHSGQTGSYDQGEIHIEILAPEATTVLRGVGGEDDNGMEIDRHSLGVVVGLAHGARRVALLPGDIDVAGLESLLDRQGQPTAAVLVFPHHGGLPGRGDPVEFSNRMCDLVEPRYVVFSIADGSRKHPRDEVVDAVHGHRSRPVLVSTGEALRIRELLDATPDCPHRSGVGDITVSLDSDPPELICGRAQE